MSASTLCAKDPPGCDGIRYGGFGTEGGEPGAEMNLRVMSCPLQQNFLFEFEESMIAIRYVNSSGLGNPGADRESRDKEC